MKVAFVGNQDNNAYRCCKFLREAGLDAHLYMIRQERGPRSFPEFVDRALAGHYPDWIHQYDDKGRISFLLPSRLARVIEDEYDVVITSGATGLLAARHFRRLPVVHLTLGSEVNDFPMRLFSLRSGGLHWRVAAWLMRRGLRHAARIITHGFWPEMRVLRRLGLLDKTFVWGLPEDTGANRKRVGTELLEELNRKYARYDRVFIWLARVNFHDPRDPEYKAPQVFLGALERLALGEKRNIKAIVGEYGKDIAAFKKMAAAKGLEPCIEYVPHMEFWKVLTYFSMANGVVVDVPDMEHGHILGGLAREGLSVGSAIISAWDDGLVGLCYGDGCPIIKAWDVDSCYQAMKRLAEMDSDEFRGLRQRSAEWADAHLHYTSRMNELIDLLRRTIYCESFRRGRRRCRKPA